MTNKPLRVVFMGTPDFAVPSLNVLIENPLTEVVAVVTQPDRPKGRGRKLMFPPVKEAAVAAGITVLQPESIKTEEMFHTLKELAPDLMVVVAFGQFLPESLLKLPPCGCVNVHASLLPKYRGAAPIHWAIMNGETVTGVTTMYMDKGMDTGDMILKAETAIPADMTTGTLHDVLMLQGANLLSETVALIAAGKAPREKQIAEEATYAALLKRSTERIQWKRTAQEIHNQVRGLNPWPGAFAKTDSMNLKIWQTRVLDDAQTGTAGMIVACTEKGFVVQTGKGLLEIVEVQPESKRKMTAQECLCGYCIHPGDTLK
ncbi:MAG: methionyl-tRNA formyltransferase [Sporomusaceae bacterium]|nr:methionyl-tRNA formyltransferase [Sporomusaceae bacterium]